MTLVHTEPAPRPSPGPADLNGLPGVERGPGPLLVLVSPAQVDLDSPGLLGLGTLQTGLGRHVVREREVVEDLLELGPGDEGCQPARYLLTVTFALIELQLVRDQEESPLKY